MVYHADMEPSAFTLVVNASRRLCLAVGVLHLLAGAAVFLADLAVGLQVLILVGVAASWAGALRPKSVSRFRCQADGSLAVEGADDWQVVVVEPDSMVLAWLVVLRYRRPAAARSETCVILSDSLDREAFRRFRVWLKWRARPGAEAGQAVSGPISR